MWCRSQKTVSNCEREYNTQIILRYIKVMLLSFAIKAVIQYQFKNKWIENKLIILGLIASEWTMQYNQL